MGTLGFVDLFRHLYEKFDSRNMLIFKADLQLSGKFKLMNNFLQIDLLSFTEESTID